MSRTVLVTFHTGEGQTAKIADRVASVLRDQGVTVDVLPVESVPSPERYDGVVVGDPIHVSHHSRAMTKWLREHASILQGRPTALFQVSMVSANPDEEHTATAHALVQQLLDDTGFDPDVVGMFAGALRLHALRLVHQAGDAFDRPARRRRDRRQPRLGVHRLGGGRPFRVRRGRLGPVGLTPACEHGYGLGMTANTDAVRAYLAAATTESDAADAALAEVLSDGVVLTGPLGEGHGPQAVLDGLAMLRPLFSTGTWADLVTDGDVVRLTATFPPGAVLGSAALTFGFDTSGAIASVQQTLAPGAPPPPVPVTLDNDIGAAIDGALDNGTTMIAAYVDVDGQPQLSFRGTTQAYGADGLALWIRDPEGGLVRALAHNPRLTFWYFDPATRTHYQIQGRGRVDHDEGVRTTVFDRSPEREQRFDPERRGVAVVVDVDRVTGRGPDGPVNMRRDAT